ncbi:MAG TPA: hypothetical protein VLK33_04770, partial [Terriglobales bacterium]|nr:hypothetical protein [Terriglobales bacterium]
MKTDFGVEGLSFKLGEYSELVSKAIGRANSENLVERIWKRDHTVWNPKPDEIAKRLGWLDVADRMQAEIPELENFTKQVKTDGFTHALLLGMGGSSLA